jgi:preprotein translocase subunit Sec61beta
VLGNGLSADPRSIVLIAINLGMVLAFASVLVRGRTAAK